MEIRPFSHYAGLERLGGGGMGVVYKAEDTRLKRQVALKFLPPELTRDDDARQRFVQEAQAASALDHPNICTIYEIDSTPDGQLFIAMAYYEGETLKKRLERARLTIEEAINIATQIAQGLVKAHQARIVHRDIKPANVMLTSDGLVKIVDFGIAKLIGLTGVTRTGSTVGTVAYMSPEQINGGAVDQQSDLWALGVVLYEMLTGSRAFRGEHDATIIHAILNTEPKPVRTVRPEVGPELERIVSRALAKGRGERYQSAAELAGDLARCRTALKPEASAPPGAEPGRRFLARRRVAIGVAAAVIGLGAATLAGWSLWNRMNERAWARAEAMPEIQRLAEQEAFAEAYELAGRVERILPGDAALVDLWRAVAADASIDTAPSGADVYVKEYAAVSAPWRHLGRAPLHSVRLPRGFKRWRLEAAGFVTLEQAAEPGELQVALAKAGSVPDDMVRIPGGPARAWIAGMDPIDRVPVDDYLIDRHEVTNRKFKAFVDAGGYSRRELWKYPFANDGRVLSFDEAMRQFQDATGRSGPATWELGTYPRGQDDYPVSGVSWYEAAAYAEYAGKSLPTVYHWVRAASTTLPALIVPLSNFSNKGPAAVGTYQGMSVFGVYDMAGNVREWLWNASGNLRHILGGAWNDPQYLFSFASAQSPFDRSAINGFRCVVYPGGHVPPHTSDPVELSHRDYSRERPVADSLFRAYLNQFSYDPSNLSARIEATSETADWRQEKVTFAAAYGSERVIAHLFLPKIGRPPYQTLVYFPGSTAIVVKDSDRFTDDGVFNFIVSFLTRSGRAVVLPVYKGTLERNDGLTSTWASPTHRHTEYTVRQIKDFRRTVDYLETRPEIDMSKLGYLGTSWGGRMAALIPAIETRIKLNIVELGGLAAGRSLPEVDQINYITHVTTPVLMINGRYDAIEPLENAQLPMFRMWGTPPEHKRHVIFETGHGPFPPNAIIKEVLDWLDRYFGPAV